MQRISNDSLAMCTMSLCIKWHMEMCILMIISQNVWCDKHTRDGLLSGIEKKYTISRLVSVHVACRSLGKCLSINPWDSRERDQSLSWPILYRHHLQSRRAIFRDRWHPQLDNPNIFNSRETMKAWEENKRQKKRNCNTEKEREIVFECVLFWSARGRNTVCMSGKIIQSNL